MTGRSIVVPLLLIGLGVLFLANTLNPEMPLFRLVAEYWPFLLIGWGALRLIEILVLFAGVVSRYVFHSPLVWSDELASILFLWLSMLGAVVALRRGEHMRMTALVNNVSPARRVATMHNASCSTPPARTAQAMATAVGSPPCGTSSNAPSKATLRSAGAKAVATNRDREFRMPLNSDTMLMKIR